MKALYQSPAAALLAGVIAFGTAACDTTGANISGRDIKGPIAAPAGPIGSTGPAGSAGSDSGDIPQVPERNQASSRQ